MSRRRTYRPQPTTDQRTPDERLEALVREPKRDRALRMLMRIRRDLEDRPEPAPWLAAARTLNERLIISDDVLYYFAELFTECMIFSGMMSDPELTRIRSEMDAIEREHGLVEGETWHIKEAPAEWRVLNTAWNDRASAIAVSTLRLAGHDDLADMREQKLAEYDRRGARGRIELFGEDDEFDRR